MGSERPTNAVAASHLSLEDGYLQVAGVCDRAEYLERAHYHASGELPVTGWPNERGERQGIPPGDYRFAFGTDGRDAMAVRKNLAAKWLHGPMPWQLLAGANPSSDWRTPPPRSSSGTAVIGRGRYGNGRASVPRNHARLPSRQTRRRGRGLHEPSIGREGIHQALSHSQGARCDPGRRLCPYRSQRPQDVSSKDRRIRAQQSLQPA